MDPRDGAAFAAWFAVVEASDRFERPDEPNWLLNEQQQASLDDSDARHVLLAARLDGRVVGAVRMDLPQRDNLHLCETTFTVHPDARRRGVGRALDDELVRRVRADGRTTILSYCDVPPGWEGTAPGPLGAVALGYAVVQEEVRRDIHLPLDPERVDHLERTCGPLATAYDIRSWWDRCPDALVDDVAGLTAALSVDAPKADMDWRAEVWDAARYRRDERLTAEMDRSCVGAAAVERSTGRAVAFTRMAFPRSEPSRAYQWETLVSREHRGHRLGVLVKLAALQALAARAPAPAYVTSWNAEENAPMIAVNDALGARINGRLPIVQKVLC